MHDLCMAEKLLLVPGDEIDQDADQYGNDGDADPTKAHGIKG
jgi:hypothetical protein